MPAPALQVSRMVAPGGEDMVDQLMGKVEQLKVRRIETINLYRAFQVKLKFGGPADGTGGAAQRKRGAGAERRSASGSICGSECTVASKSC